MAEFSKIVDFPTVEDQFNHRLVKRTLAEQPESDSAYIFRTHESLTKAGWKTNLFATNDLPEMTTVVDFDAKVIIHNNHKAYHTLKVLNEIQEHISLKTSGKWVFYYVNGDVTFHDDGSLFFVQDLRVLQLPDCYDVKSS